MGAGENQKWPVQVFPLLVPLAEGNVCIYEGFLTLESLPTPPNLWIRLTFPGPNNVKGPRTIQCSQELHQLLASFSNTVQKRLHSSLTPSAFLVELRDLMERAVMLRLPTQPPRLDYHPQLFHELDAIGWDRIVNLEPDLSKICFSSTDAAGRQHTLTLSMGADYPRKAPVVEAHLPTPLQLSWTDKCGLQHVLKQWEQALHNWQDLWACLTNLDNNTWVLDPVCPSWSDTSRRIALGGHASITLHLHLDHPRLCPEALFVGARSTVEPLQHAWIAHAHLWSEDRPMHANLEVLLGIPLPQRDESQLEDVSGDCSICYTYRLSLGPRQGGGPGEDEELPDVHCRNPNCGRPFHKSCLVQWLVALPKSTKCNDTIFGECPYCTATLFVDTL